MSHPPEPLTLTVEEAACVLRIGRTTAYALAREWRSTGGRSGLPVLELGRTLRVPRAALADLLDVPTIGTPHRRAQALSKAPSPAKPVGASVTPSERVMQPPLWSDDEEADSR